MSGALTPQQRAANASLVEQIRSAHAGHLAAQKALWQVAQGQGGQDVIDQARASLGDDIDALTAFGRSLLRGRDVG